MAVIGMACRFPGGVRSAEDLWSLVAQGRDAIGDFPADRGWDLDTLYRTTEVRQGGFLDGASEFDAEFFGISAREALAMDPQQRLLLECAWEAVERAGIDPLSLRESRTAVFVGVNHQEYGAPLWRAPAEVTGHLVTGVVPSVASGRISYALGLEGPAVTVDTACSTSLVALHLAVKALRAGECDLAIVGGATVMAMPGPLIEFSRQRALSVDGRCKAFSAEADGMAMAEGAGLVVLQRASDARRPLALIRGSAVNQDGASNGLTAPNGPSQQRVIRAALNSAGLSPSDVDAVEAHGTGTELGDPIEASALADVYGGGRSPDNPLWLGSVKSNIGHTQAASGVAGLIKTVMSLRHGLLPKTLHAERPTPHVDWQNSGLALVREPLRLSATHIGISSFGISGTNAHVIVERAEEPGQAVTGAGPVPCLLSARTAHALREQARQLREHVERSPDTALTALGSALATTRSHFARRAVITARDRADLVAGLDRLANSADDSEPVTGGATAFVFPGQGTQRTGMGEELYRTSPVNAAAFDALCAELDRHLRRPLREVMSGPLDRTEFAQPALFAVEVAMYRLLESWGVRPDFLIGHSLGELAAAHVAGVMSLADAAEVVAVRARLMQDLPAGGAMIVLGMEERAVAGLLAPFGGRLSIAAVNGPQSTVVSGDADAIAELGVDATELKVSHAFHSHRVEPMLDRYRDLLAGVELRPPTIPIVSNLTGAVADPDELCSPDYWVRQARDAVRFHDGLKSLVGKGVGVFLEVGPSGALQVAEVRGTVITGALDLDHLVAAVGRAHVLGAKVDWSRILGRHHVDLPTYPFQRRSYWLARHTAAAPRDHPLLRGAEGGNTVFEGEASATTQPWLADHVIDGTTVVPGTAFVELATWIDRSVDELTMVAPLALEDGAHVRIVVDGRSLTISSRPFAASRDAPWTVNAVGTFGTVTAAGTDSTAGFDLAARPPADACEVRLDSYYESLDQEGFAYGPALRGLTALRRGGTDVFGEARLPDGTDPRGYGIHPALLDAVLHGARLLMPPGVPFSFTGIRMFRPAGGAIRFQLSPVDGGFRVLVADTEGRPVLRIDRVTLRETGGAALFTLDWTPIPAGPPERDITVVSGELPHLVPQIQEFLAGERSRLVVVTRQAEDWRQASVWSMIRSVQAEHPGRLVLVDTDQEGSLLAEAVGTGQPQVAIRDGKLLSPRVVRVPPGGDTRQATGTVLVTGAFGALGSAVARHLVTRHAVRELLLVGRRGDASPGAAELIGQLRELGADVTTAACDVADREALAEVIESVPLGGVVHAAGVLDDSVFSGLTRERFDHVLAPKATGAWNLHELTKDRDLSMFVLFSSAAATLGNAGQANYAAANGFLDGLARHRHAMGLVATSIAWGPWDSPTGMTARLTDGDMARIGTPKLSTKEGLRLFDAALASGLPTVVAYDPGRRIPREVPAAQDLTSKLAGLAKHDQHRLLVDMVSRDSASVLGLDAPDPVGEHSSFRDLGFDSLIAIELRNRLSGRTGLRLAPTVAFDHPTPAALAAHIWSELAGTPLDLPAVRAVAPDAAPSEWQVELFDLDGYLRRIGVDRQGLGPTPATLRTLQARQMAAIGFHNIDVLLSRPISLELVDVQRKLLAPNSGGTCAEHNMMLAAALELLGFTVRRISGRIRNGTDTVRPLTHMALLVEIDGLPWLVDVGLGGEGPTEPVPMHGGDIVGTRPWRWRALPLPDGDSLLQVEHGDGWFDLYSFNDQPQHYVDYLVAHYYSVTYPGIPFANILVAHKIGPAERHVLFDDRYTRSTAAGDVVSRQLDPEELPALLRDVFGIRLTEQELQKVVNR
ncbi:SDR family NAD(P)-dependent oxidoreductase [Streptomyces sp. NPDC059627]